MILHYIHLFLFLVTLSFVEWRGMRTDKHIDRGLDMAMSSNRKQRDDHFYRLRGIIAESSADQNLILQDLRMDLKLEIKKRCR